jgi:glyoxylate/hydroxypyruvate reductase A
MVDDGLTEGMVEWVTGHVLRHHLGMDTHIHGQDGVWRAGSAPPLARDRTVAVLGLGVLGAACAQALSALNFPGAGLVALAQSHRRHRTPIWTRWPRRHPAEGRDRRAAPARHASDGKHPERPHPRAPAPGRGHREPRPRAADRRRRTYSPRSTAGRSAMPRSTSSGPSPACRAPLLGPSPRSRSRPISRPKPAPPSAARVIVENIRRGEAGEPFLHLVDRDAGILIPFIFP